MWIRGSIYTSVHIDIDTNIDIDRVGDRDGSGDRARDRHRDATGDILIYSIHVVHMFACGREMQRESESGSHEVEALRTRLFPEAFAAFDESSSSSRDNCHRMRQALVLPSFKSTLMIRDQSAVWNMTRIRALPTCMHRGLDKCATCHRQHKQKEGASMLERMGSDKCHPLRRSQMPMKSMVKVSCCVSITSAPARFMSPSKRNWEPLHCETLHHALRLCTDL